MISYQLSKYKNFSYTMENILSLYYKKSRWFIYKFFKILKEAGYITSQISDIYDINMNNINSIYLDHKNFIMACHPNYFLKKEFSPYERCLYGKPISYYLFNYNFRKNIMKMKTILE